MTSQEARAALLYLRLQWQDDIAGKGLTKLPFDALVRAALRHTHSEKRMTRSQIKESIQRYLPSADTEQLSRQVDSALQRLTKRYIRHWKAEDEFCLSYEEHQRILIKLAQLENEEAAFHEEVSGQCHKTLSDIAEATEADSIDLVARIPRLIEMLLLRRGEVFVSTVITGNLHRLGLEQLTDIVLKDLEANRPPDNIRHHLPGIIAAIVHNLFARPKDSTQHYLRRLANSYTLFSFPKGNARCTVRYPQIVLPRQSVARYYRSPNTYRGAT